MADHRPHVFLSLHGDEGFVPLHPRRIDIILQGFYLRFAAPPGRDLDLSLADAEYLVYADAPDDDASPYDAGPVAERFHVRKDVGGEEDRLSLPFEVEKDVPDHLAAQRIEAGERLVEYQKIGIVKYRLREPGPLKHPLRETLQFLPRASFEPDQRYDLFASRREDFPRQAAHPAAVIEELAERKVREEPGILREVSDPRERLPTACLFAEYGDTARIGPHEPENDLYRRRLAGAVRTEESEYLPFSGEEGDAAKDLPRALRQVAPVGLGDPVNCQSIHRSNPFQCCYRPGRNPAPRLLRDLRTRHLPASAGCYPCAGWLFSCRYRRPRPSARIYLQFSCLFRAGAGPEAGDPAGTGSAGGFPGPSSAARGKAASGKKKGRPAMAALRASFIRYRLLAARQRDDHVTRVLAATGDRITDVDAVRVDYGHVTGLPGCRGDREHRLGADVGEGVVQQDAARKQILDHLHRSGSRRRPRQRIRRCSVRRNPRRQAEPCGSSISQTPLWRAPAC